MQFKETYFLIIYDLLCIPGKSFATREFNNYFRNDVVSFFSHLVDLGIAKRGKSSGCKSSIMINKPNELLLLAIRNFRDFNTKEYCFANYLSHEEIISRMIQKKLDFFVANFSGINPKLKYADDGILTFYVTDKTFFQKDNLDLFQINMKMYKVKFGGNIKIIYPRFKRFLNYKKQLIESLYYPSDFYTYLVMASGDYAMGQPQKEYTEQKLKGLNGNFLSWMS